MHDREPSRALDATAAIPLTGPALPLSEPAIVLPDPASFAEAVPLPEPAAARPDPTPVAEPADVPAAFGPDGQAARLVQAVGVDAVLAGFIAWLASQSPNRVGPPTPSAPAAARRRCHRAVERFLRWHHGHETGAGLPCGDGGVAAYDAALRQSGAGEAELTYTRRALGLLAEYTQTDHPHWRWTP